MVPSKKKILLVDDEQSILKILRIKLKVSGYEVITASDGKEALELCESVKPDIMLLDIIMPAMDGFEVLGKLCRRSKMPVIACSARPENGPKALSMGARDFLLKPFDVDDMVKRIQYVLG